MKKNVQPNLDQAAEIFENASGLEPDARDEYLDVACGTNAQLRAEIESMIRASEQQGAFLAEPTQDAAPCVAERPGDTIGRYKLLQCIGEGGFGVVFMAQQTEPVKRKVALKIIKPGMDTRQVIARFEAERQALALMDHPNIARVLDAGATDSGRPYFVMELVRGVPIVEYCDTEKLDTDARLELFIDVCRAIQHAHQKGIIHRDIKPTNVLVTLHDGVPVPKVIDFGIAKATSTELTTKTLFTEFRQMIGTPAYTSPEQAEMSGLDIDTRSDIYSLGVLLYELLTGTTPFDAKELRSMGFAEMMRVIRELEPAKPSTRLSSLGKSAAQTAERRASDVWKLSLLLRGDLDWIVMKCLEKDRTRRYETATDLANDIRRHLGDEPVVASPPSATYRLRKLVRRNKGVFAAGTTVALALVLGLTAATAGFAGARRAQVRAAEEAERTSAVAAFYKDMFESVNPGIGGHSPVAFSDLKVEDLLNKAEPKVSSFFANQPLLEADVRSTLARSYAGLGRFDLAIAQEQRVLELRSRILGDDHPDTLHTTRSLCSAMWMSGHHSDSIARLRRAVERGAPALGDDHPVVIDLRSDLAFGLWGRDGELAEAESIAADNYQRARRVLGVQAKESLWAGTVYGILLSERGRLKEAEAALRDSLQTARETQAPNTTAMLFPAFQLAICLGRQGKYDEALEQANSTIAGYRRAFGDTHPWVEHVRCVQLWLVAEHGDLEAAATLRDEILARQREILGPDHEYVKFTEGSTLPLLIKLGRLEEAEETARRFLRIMDSLPGVRERELYPKLQFVLGWTLLERGRLQEAESLLRSALDGHVRRLPGGNNSTPEYRYMHGRCLSELDRFGEAEPLLLAAYEGELSMRGPEHKDTKRCIGALADLYERWGKPEDAERWRAHDVSVLRD